MVIIRLVITMVLPIIGFVFFIVIDISLRSKGKEHDFDFNQITSSSDYSIFDWNNKRDIIPIEEALLLNDNIVKRDLVINMVKEKRLSNVNGLKLALQDEDTETSHYAASAIMQIKSEFENKIKEISVKYEQNNNDSELIGEYISILKDYIDSGLMERQMEKRFRNDYSKLLAQIINLGTKEKEYYIMKINIDLDMEDYQQARYFCNLFLDKFEKLEDPYLLYMKLYYSLKDYDMLNKTIEQLVELPISLSNEALNKIRFWTAMT
ncbi:hypothetical protein [Vallitalea sp.]|uniref:hypothetical protein n=1 Tax=Vallitalea sp. TaxID=1882829 RepID=UPI0025FDEFE5|nr:hypothetical protein [Vallitalea sp.]MCT4688364.1 hypothetical protein [Vallitalea sp.]